MPLLAIGLGLTAGGSVLSSVANNQSQQAVKGVRDASMLRQNELEQNARNTFQKSASQAGAPAANANMARGVAQRMADLQALQSAPTAGATPQPQEGSYAVTGAEGQPTNNGNGRAGAATAAWANAVNGASARMGGYEDNATTQGIQSQQAGNELSVISNKSRGEASVLPGEMEAASHRGDKLQGWGQIVSALGSATSLGSATGAFGSWGGAGAPAGTITTPTASYAPNSVLSSLKGALY